MQIGAGMIHRGKGTMIFTDGTAVQRPRSDKTDYMTGKAVYSNVVETLGERLGPKGIHVARVTIDGRTNPNGPQKPGDLDHTAVAEIMWKLHMERRPWTKHVVITPPVWENP